MTLLLGEFFSRRRWFAAALVITLGVSVSAQAQDVDPELQKKYDDAFQSVFADPGNLDKTFRFAELAVQTRNFEAAISALERMLLINPNLPRVRLELGVLYFRLGSYQLAKTYLDRAVEGENVPDEVRQRVETFLAEIEKRLSRHQFSGSVFGGVRYQTNANAGPTSGTVLANGITATLSDQFTKTSDENLFVSANVRHTYDLQLQAGEVWETNLTVYGSEPSFSSTSSPDRAGLSRRPGWKLLHGARMLRATIFAWMTFPTSKRLVWA